MVDLPQPGAWMTWAGASDTAIAARIPRCLLINDSQSGRFSKRAASPLTPPWPVKLTAARTGPRSDASLHDAETVSVTNVAMVGPT